MKKTWVFLGILLVFLSLYGFLRFTPCCYQSLLKLLTRDSIYLSSDTVIQGWIWDEHDGAIMGEHANGELFLVPESSVIKIKRDAGLTLLRNLM
ncbi:MAG: hypothetical protein KBA46_07755 [Candidatus Omnitrophica bacterium]|nr:hypothetical protein [Candidatus Omnitrophota bacterium]